MPKGPKGEKRPADVVGAAVKVMQIATGEIEEKTDDGKNKAAQELGRKGGKARADQRSTSSPSTNVILVSRPKRKRPAANAALILFFSCAQACRNDHTSASAGYARRRLHSQP